MRLLYLPTNKSGSFFLATISKPQPFKTWAGMADSSQAEPMVQVAKECGLQVSPNGRAYERPFSGSAVSRFHAHSADPR
jgi:hypothetical protein